MSLIEPNETQQLVLAQAGEHLPGTPYRIIEKIGGGGMGQVFLGEHTELGREVAIKLLAPQLAEDAQAMERLRREARAAARIGHPHIIDTYDLGVSDDGRPYVVMRNIRGHDLKKVLDTQAPLSPARVLHLARQIASALAAAHKVGIIHRDLKPENVMVEIEGRVSEHVTVLDFGIAQSIQDGDTRLTRAGQVIGTPGYMAPEQALAQPLDGRADEYSLAVICYELLNGDSPYPRNTPLQVIAAQLTQAPRAFKVSTIPEPIRAVVLRGMARQAEDRYAGVDAFIEALEIAVEQAEAEAPPEAGRLQRLMVITLAALVLLGGGYLGYRALSAAPVDARPDSGLSAMASAPDAALKAMANTPDAALKAMANTPDAALKAPDAALKAPDAALKAPDTQQARQRARRLAMAAEREAAREAAKREEAAREAAKREEAARQAAKREEAA
ncbi:serine/threonine protein kinase, partial [Myxococcota bacterium]|nr:serine/threonine protein kinase [Myxococcota bacterium]